MKKHLILLVVFCHLAGDLLTGKAWAKTKTPKGSIQNVIIIITDDQGYGDMSCHGNPYIKTPNLDRLYQESTRFTDFHVSPTCAPTRAALMTGLYSNRTGVWHTIGGRSLLKTSEITMAEVFAANGYATGIFGKWHLGDNYPFRPQDQGFQKVLVHGGGGIGQGPDFWGNDYFDDTYFHNGNPEKFTGYCTDVWFDNAMNFMAQKQEEEKPFFCYLSTNSPHGPYNIGEEYAAPYNSNNAVPAPAFNGMISNIDENLGRLLSFLENSGLEDNTLLLFMTDNGTSAGVTFEEQGNKVEKGFNAGMRGKKGSMYEGGHRVPFFIRWPGIIPSGRDIDDLAAHIDVLPTLVDLLELKMSHKVLFDGRSLEPVLLGKTARLPLRTLITDSQRLEQPVKWRQSSVMRGKWRMVNGKELYDIALDPGQTRDIAHQYPGMLKGLRKDYERWWKDISPTFIHTPFIPLGHPKAPVTLLRSHDMHMDDEIKLVPWNQRQVREGMKTQGWFAVEVMQPGTYEISLMRWPPEINKGILEGIPGIPPLPGTTVAKVPEGMKLNIKEAIVSIGELKESKTVAADVGAGISFEVPLEAGEYRLRASFVDGTGEPFAAYYVIVEKI